MINDAIRWIYNGTKNLFPRCPQQLVSVMDVDKYSGCCYDLFAKVGFTENISDQVINVMWVYTEIKGFDIYLGGIRNYKTWRSMKLWCWRTPGANVSSIGDLYCCC